MNNNQNHTVSALQNLINELSSKNISIIKVASDNTGVITLNEEDCLWIEQLSQASLINNEEQYFLTSDSRLTFDFAYVQSQIIRKYLLLCRINYRHIIQKYQCHTRRIQTTTKMIVESLDLNEKYLIPLSHYQLENEWNHLKEMLLDKLYNAYNLLRQIALILKNHQDDKSSLNLFEFIKITDHDNDIHQRLEQYEIKDFQLCHIDHVLKLYAESISGFQYLFTDIPPLLRIPIDAQLDDELIQKLNENIIDIDYNNDIDKLHSRIQTITDFLNELKTIEDTLLQQSAQSLIETCKYLANENPILLWIPERIKCENYVALNIHLIRTRSILQERKVNIEEKETKLWNENLNLHQQQDKQGNRFHQYLNSQTKEQTFNEKSDDWILPVMDTESSNIDLTNENNLLNINQQQNKAKEHFNELIEYSSLMELNIKSVPCTSSVFIQQIHKYQEELQVEPIIITKAQKFTIVYPDKNSVTYLWKTENFFERLKKLFHDKKFDHDILVVVDKNEIFVDFTKNDYRPPHQSLLEYHIIEKQLLIQVQFQFRTQIFEYLTTSKCNISTIIHRFIDDNHLSSDIILHFFDEYGKCIDDGIIADLYKTDSKKMLIFVRDETSNTHTLSQLILRYQQGN